MATRLYLEHPLPNPLVPPVSPAFDAAWDVTTLADRVIMGTQKRGSTNTVKVSGAETSTSVVNVLNRQFISAPLQGAQTITGTVKGQIRASETSAAADARAQIVIRVVQSDGVTIRGTLLAADNVSALSSEFGTGTANRKFPLAAVSPATLTSVAAQDGDRIVIEVGARNHNTLATSYTHSLLFGTSSGTDSPEDETTTTNRDVWIELSQTLTFYTYAVVGGVAAQVLTKSVGKARAGYLLAQVLTKGRTGARTPFENLVLALGPVAFYKLDETSGTTFDNAEGTAARDGTSYGTPTLGDPSLVPNAPSGKSFTTDGTAGIDTPSLTDFTLQELTLMASIKTTTVVAADKTIIGKDGSGTTNRQWQFKLGATHLFTVNLLNSGTVVVTGSGGAALNDGVAHLVLLTYDGFLLRGYVDGKIVFTDTNTAGTLLAAGTTGFTIGARAPNTHTLPFIGTLDDVAVFPRALPYNDVEALYAAWGAPPTTTVTNGSSPWSTKWDVAASSTTPVNGAWSTKWDVRTLVTGSAWSTKWNITSGVSDSWSTLWVIHSGWTEHQVDSIVWNDNWINSDPFWVEWVDIAKPETGWYEVETENPS